MTLTDQVRDLQDRLGRGDSNRDAALKRAEQLAERFADIKPQPLAMPMEKYFGTPAFHGDKQLKSKP